MKNRLMAALDVTNAAEARVLSKQLEGSVSWFKIGLRLFVAEGPALVHEIRQRQKVFLDLKFHDIPNTVAQAIASAGSLGVEMTNVHAAGGSDMLRAAAAAAADFPAMRLIAVTVLTSSDMPAEQARHLVVERALWAQDAGLHGVVCSVHEVAAIKQACGADFLTVTPGIRWGGQAHQDQRRVADPESAIRAGADYLVVGRPILQAQDPRQAAAEAIALMRQSLL